MRVDYVFGALGLSTPSVGVVSLHTRHIIAHLTVTRFVVAFSVAAQARAQSSPDFVPHTSERVGECAVLVPVCSPVP